MQVFVSQLNEPLSKIFIEALKSKFDHEENEEKSDNALKIVGSLVTPDAESDVARYADKWILKDQHEDVVKLACESDVIVLNLMNSVDEASNIIRALRGISGSKNLVVVSSLMTWKNTPSKRSSSEEKNSEEADRSEMFSESQLSSRRPARDYLLAKTVETQALSLAHDTLSATVVASGYVYGCGEFDFHDIFKSAWLNQEYVLPGPCTNVVPTIHAEDLAQALCSIVERPPSQQYVIAVDRSHSKLCDIVTCVFSVMQPHFTLAMGDWRDAPRQPRILDPNDAAELLLKEKSWDRLSLDMRFDCDTGVISKLVRDWRCKEGLIENIATVIEEYKLNRKLNPIKLLISSAPYVDVSTLVSSLSSEYSVPRVSVSNATEYLLGILDSERKTRQQKLDEIEAQSVLSEESEDQKEAKEEERRAAKEAILKKSALELLGETVEGNTNLSDELKAQVLRVRMLSPECQNQGYLVDCKSFIDAQSLFQHCYRLPQPLKNSSTEEKVNQGNGEEGKQAEDEERKKTESENTFTLDNHIAPTHVVYLDDADDELIRLAVALGNEQKKCETELKEYRQSFDESRPLNFFENECGVNVLQVGPRGAEESKVEESAIDCIRAALEKNGKPFNYGLKLEIVNDAASSTEEKHEPAISGETKVTEDIVENMEGQPLEESEDQAQRTANALARDEKKLKARSAPFRRYLLETIMPALSQGLVETCKAEPEDPVAYLAEFMFDYKPSTAVSEK